MNRTAYPFHAAPTAMDEALARDIANRRRAAATLARLKAGRKVSFLARVVHAIRNLTNKA